MSFLRRTSLFTASCLFLALLSFADAQEATTASSPAEEASGSAAEATKDAHTLAAEDLLKAMRMKETSERTVDQMLAMQMQQQPQLAQFKDVMQSFLRKHLSYESIKDDMVKLYKAEFSKDELNELSKFYRTPVGKKAVEKLPMLSAAGAQIGMQRVQQNMGELQKAIMKRQTELTPAQTPEK